MKIQLRDYQAAAKALVLSAQSLSDERGHAQVEPLHLLHRLLHAGPLTRSVVKLLGIEPDDLLAEAELCLRRAPRRAAGDAVAYLASDFVSLLQRAEAEVQLGQPGQAGTPRRVGERELALALAQCASGDVRLVLKLCGLSATELRSAWVEYGGAAKQAVAEASALGVDLTGGAEKGRFDPVVGRAQELRRVIRVLARRHGHNPLLVGEAGVGKRSIVTALAARVAVRDVPDFLADARIVELRLSQFLSESRNRSELTQRFGEWVSGLADRAQRVLVHVRDLPILLEERTAAGLVEPFFTALREQRLQVIATVDSEAGRAVLANTEWASLFSAVEVQPPSEAEAVAMLRGVVASYERVHGVRITDPALVASVALAKRYLPSAELPGSAIDVMDEAAARVVVEQQSVAPDLDQVRREMQGIAVQLESLRDDTDQASLRARQKLQEVQDELRAQESGIVLVGQDKQAKHSGDGAGLLGSEPMARGQVTERHVADIIAERTHVPVSRMLEDEAKKLRNMEARVGKRVIGQARAVGAVARAVARSRTGLRDGGRPIGSFLFLGTSGVGKTELAKAVAEFLFDDEAALTRLDMSEFMEKHAVARLLGAPPGYVDSDQGGFLTEAVRRRPYSVILLDEVEKAHPDVFNIMLQVLDDGRLTDARGRVAHFADTVIIMTCNLGSHHLLDDALDDAQKQERVLESLHGHFRPEFLNRIDDIVTFEILDRASLLRILEIHIAKLTALLATRQLKLQITDGAKQRLAQLADQPAFGARPLRRVLQREVADPIAEALLLGAAAGSKVLVDVVNNVLSVDITQRG